ncbi:hypothetical protein [Micromonospora sp. RTP1Z1]|nr:hypothetical protein [Micromonospora sp. RTP1Z1]
MTLPTDPRDDRASIPQQVSSAQTQPLRHEDDGRWVTIDARTITR